MSAKDSLLSLKAGACGIVVNFLVKGGGREGGRGRPVGIG